MMNEPKKYFQDFIPGNVCFGCGTDNEHGLHTKSFWDGDEAICIWQPQEKYHGWPNLLNGGIICTLIDCHCMCAAMAHAYRLENRSLDTMPEYRYATGTLTVKYLHPTSNYHPVEIRSRIVEVKNRKTTLACDFYSQGIKTAEAHVIAIRVFDSSQNESSAFI